MDNNIELIREINGVQYFSNPTGDSPDQTVSTLESFNQKVILLAGGYDDNASCESMGNAMVDKVKHLILFGQTTAMLEMSLMRKLVGKNQGIDIRITHCSTLRQAVDCAYLSSKPGDIVLLSPAGSCIDIYSNMEELRSVFKQFVDAL